MEDFTMTTINLKDFYYWYTQDQLIEVSDEVAEVFMAKFMTNTMMKNVHMPY